MLICVKELVYIVDMSCSVHVKELVVILIC